MKKLGLFEFSGLMHYRPRNETGGKWKPYGATIYEFSKGSDKVILYDANNA